MIFWLIMKFLMKIKIDQKSYQNILFYHIGYVTVKDLSYMTRNSVKPLLYYRQKNRYIEESNGNKYLALVTTDESKDTLKKYEELWQKSETLLDQ